MIALTDSEGTRAAVASFSSVSFSVFLDQSEQGRKVGLQAVQWQGNRDPWVTARTWEWPVAWGHVSQKTEQKILWLIEKKRIEFGELGTYKIFGKAGGTGSQCTSENDFQKISLHKDMPCKLLSTISRKEGIGPTQHLSSSGAHSQHCDQGSGSCCSCKCPSSSTKLVSGHWDTTSENKTKQKPPTLFTTGLATHRN